MSPKIINQLHVSSSFQFQSVKSQTVGVKALQYECISLISTSRLIHNLYGQTQRIFVPQTPIYHDYFYIFLDQFPMLI